MYHMLVLVWLLCTEPAERTCKQQGGKLKEAETDMFSFNTILTQEKNW